MTHCDYLLQQRTCWYVVSRFPWTLRRHLEHIKTDPSTVINIGMVYFSEKMNFGWLKRISNERFGNRFLTIKQQYLSGIIISNLNTPPSKAVPFPPIIFASQRSNLSSLTGQHETPCGGSFCNMLSSFFIRAMLRAIVSREMGGTHLSKQWIKLIIITLSVEN